MQRFDADTNFSFRKVQRMAKKRGKTKPIKSKVKPKSKAARAAKKGPRSQPLPGLEQVRDAVLDNICEGIGDERGRMNAAKTEEKGLIQAALQRMQKRGLSVFRHAGVELARVPGAEKLRVRLTKEAGDAGEEDLEPAEVTDAQLDQVDAQHDADDAEDVDAGDD